MKAESDTVLKSWYDAYAPVYDRQWARYNEATLSVAVRALSKVKRPGDEHLLDVACGTGLLASKVAARFPTLRISGVDLNDAMLAQARDHFGDPDRFDWKAAPAEEIPYDDDSFDLVTCTNAFHLVSDPVSAMSEIRRVLRPGGAFIMVDWCRNRMPMKVMLAALAVRGGPRRRVLTVGECGRLLASCGLEVAEIAEFRARPLWGMMVATSRKPVRARVTPAIRGAGAPATAAAAVHSPK
jgi:ubiquinone/menaquinone biosynthesis C-methylase UbiE